MFKRIYLTIIISLAALYTHADPVKGDCFIAKENDKIIKEKGLCNKARAPFSTFKIVLALIGFDDGILKSATEPLIEYNDQIKKEFEPNYYNPIKYPIQKLWMRSTIPLTYMQYSVLWYSHYITKHLGFEKFKKYVTELNYGNADVSGTPGKDDGLFNAWLGTSLVISPVEQVEFLEKLASYSLPLSKSAQSNTIKILQIENMWDDWKFFGKTGGGMKNGWFVGWIEKNDRRIVFAQYVESENSLISCGRLAKEMVKDNLINIILPG